MDNKVEYVDDLDDVFQAHGTCSPGGILLRQALAPLQPGKGVVIECKDDAQARHLQTNIHNVAFKLWGSGRKYRSRVFTRNNIPCVAVQRTKDE